LGQKVVLALKEIINFHISRFSGQLAAFLGLGLDKGVF
jgi:hypothetical protein